MGWNFVLCQSNRKGFKELIEYRKWVIQEDSDVIVLGDCFDGSCWIIHFVYTPSPTETFSKCTVYNFIRQMFWVPNGHQRQVWFLWPLFLARPTADAEHAAILRHNKVRLWWRNEATVQNIYCRLLMKEILAIFLDIVGMIEFPIHAGIHGKNRLSTHSRRKMIICHLSCTLLEGTTSFPVQLYIKILGCCPPSGNSHHQDHSRIPKLNLCFPLLLVLGGGLAF